MTGVRCSYVERGSVCSGNRLARGRGSSPGDDRACVSRVRSPAGRHIGLIGLGPFEGV